METSRDSRTLDVGPEEAQCQRTRWRRGGGGMSRRASALQLDESRERGLLNSDAADDWLRRGTRQVCDGAKTASGWNLSVIGEHAGQSS